MLEVETCNMADATPAESSTGLQRRHVKEATVKFASYNIRSWRRSKGISPLKLQSSHEIRGMMLQWQIITCKQHLHPATKDAEFRRQSISSR